MSNTLMAFALLLFAAANLIGCIMNYKKENWFLMFIQLFAGLTCLLAALRLSLL